MQYDDFYEIKEIGSGGYGTVYTAKHKINKGRISKQELVVLKKFKNIDNKIELFISEVSIHTLILITALIMHIRVNRVLMKVILI